MDVDEAPAGPPTDELPTLGDAYRQREDVKDLMFALRRRPPRHEKVKIFAKRKRKGKRGRLHDENQYRRNSHHCSPFRPHR